MSSSTSRFSVSAGSEQLSIVFCYQYTILVYTSTCDLMIKHFELIKCIIKVKFYIHSIYQKVNLTEGPLLFYQSNQHITIVIVYTEKNTWFRYKLYVMYRYLYFFFIMPLNTCREATFLFLSFNVASLKNSAIIIAHNPQYLPSGIFLTFFFKHFTWVYVYLYIFFIIYIWTGWIYIETPNLLSVNGLTQKEPWTYWYFVNNILITN